MLVAFTQVEDNSVMGCPKVSETSSLLDQWLVQDLNVESHLIIIDIVGT
jgi:hypothetical protein